MDRDIRIVVSIGTSVLLSGCPFNKIPSSLLILYSSLAQTLERRFQVFSAFSNLDLGKFIQIVLTPSQIAPCPLTGFAYANKVNPEIVTNDSW